MKDVTVKEGTRVEFGPALVKDSIRNNLIKTVEIIQSMGGSNAVIDIDQLYDRVEKETTLIHQIENVSYGAHNLLKLLGPVITANLPLHPEIGITVNGTIIGMLMDAQGLNHDEFLNKNYPNDGYTTDPIPVPVVKDHMVLEIVTTMGTTIGWNTIFRTYSLGEGGVQVEMSDLPIIRDLNGWIDYATIIGWRYPTEEAVAKFKESFTDLLDDVTDPTTSQMNQIEKWILFDNGLYSQEVADSQKGTGLERGEEKEVEVPLDGVAGQSIKDLVVNAANMQDEVILPTDDNTSSAVDPNK